MVNKWADINVINDKGKFYSVDLLAFYFLLAKIYGDQPLFKVNVMYYKNTDSE